MRNPAEFSRVTKCCLAALFLFAALILPPQARAQNQAASSSASQPSAPPVEQGVSIYRRHITVPMAAAGPAGLEGWLVVPRTSAKPPLLLLSDGSHFHHLQDVGPGALLPEALWFAHRGWAVAIVLRRGLGQSGGDDSDSKLHKMLCSEATFEWLQETDADDLRAAYAYLATQPDIDATRTVAAGYFFAGAAAMWLAENQPPGLKAVLNFDGGWGTMPDWGLKGKVHAIPDVIVPSFAKLGASTKTPMIWLYLNKRGELGERFGIKSATAAYQAFTAAGGVAEMHVLRHKGDSTRFLFEENPDEWGPLVEKFLARLNLPSAEIIPPEPEIDVKTLPKLMSDTAKEAYLRFQRRGPAKAFAVSVEEGAWGYSEGMATLEQARNKALSNCHGQHCKVIATDE